MIDEVTVSAAALPTSSRPSWYGRGPWRGLRAVAALAAVALVCCSAPSSAAPDLTAEAAFYVPPSPLPAGHNGDLIRHESMNAVLGAAGVLGTAQRIMY